MNYGHSSNEVITIIIIIITIIIIGIYKVVTIIDITVASAKRTLLNAVVWLLVPTSKQQKSR